MPFSADATREQLGTAWRRLLLPFAVAEDAAATAFTDLVNRYGEAGRHYHNLRHLAEVLAVVDGLADESGDASAVRLAAWFHDAVYDSRAKDNEERSADLAETVLGGFGLPGALVANVRRLVLLTKTHAADPGDGDGHVLLDADLAILGADEGRYGEYAGAIRREYSWVDEAAYREGRGRVLEGFLRRPRLYFTDALYGSHESRARTNLRRELAALRAE
jgi:predicted metal-dependent HD superfamily phosphohydrolase